MLPEPLAAWAFNFIQSHHIPSSFRLPPFQLQYTAAFSNFKKNMVSAYTTNSDTSAEFWTGANEFADQGPSDFLASRLMTKAPSIPSSTATNTNTAVTAAADVNWVAAGKVHPIRNQGNCGSCWAFAATSAIESRYMITYGLSSASSSSVKLSEQQMVSCTNSKNGYYSGGCNGGSSGEALDYVARQALADLTDPDYPLLPVPPAVLMPRLNFLGKCVFHPRAI